MSAATAFDSGASRHGTESKDATPGGGRLADTEARHYSDGTYVLSTAIAGLDDRTMTARHAAMTA